MADPDGLRHQAEEVTQEDLEDLSPEEIRQRLQELRVRQAELEATRARYFDLYNLAPVGYCTLDPQGLILETNLTAADLLGESRARMIDEPITRFILPDDQDIYYHYCQNLFDTQTGELLACELRMLRRDGRALWVRMESTVVQDLHGQPQCRLVLIDIDARKQAEAQKEIALQALQRSEARYLAIIEEQTELVCRYLPDGRLSFVNEAYVRYFGQKRQDILNRNYLPNIPEADIARIQEQLHAITHQAPLAEFEHRVIMPDGTVRWQTWTHRGIYSPQGELLEFQAVGVDITQRKWAEEALRERAEALRQALDQIRTLQGILPICAWCKKIRDDSGYWNKVEVYIREHTGAEFTHGICPDCMMRLQEEFRQEEPWPEEVDGGENDS